MLFLKMVKLKERKLKYYLNSKLKNYEKANHLGIKVRRLQQLKSEYKKTGEIPKLIKTRRPKTELTEEYKQLIDKALKEQIDTEIEQLKTNPYVGKPLGYKFFREKRVKGGHRFYFLMTAVPKKTTCFST